MVWFLHSCIPASHGGRGWLLGRKSHRQGNNLVSGIVKMGEIYFLIDLNITKSCRDDFKPGELVYFSHSAKITRGKNNYSCIHYQSPRFSKVKCNHYESVKMRIACTQRMPRSIKQSNVWFIFFLQSGNCFQFKHQVSISTQAILSFTFTPAVTLMRLK